MLKKSELREVLSIFTESFKSALSRQFMIEVSENINKVDFTSDFVTSFIEINCTRFKGQVRLHTTNDCLIKLYNETLGEDLQSLGEENLDFSGEIMNILYCLSRDRLINEKHFDLESEIPIIKQDAKLVAASTKEYFKCEFGEFILELFENNWATRMAS